MSRQNLSLINEHHTVGVTEPISISREEVSARVDVDVENSRYWEGGGEGEREGGGTCLSTSLISQKMKIIGLPSVMGCVRVGVWREKEGRSAYSKSRAMLASSLLRNTAFFPLSPLPLSLSRSNELSETEWTANVRLRITRWCFTFKTN